MKRKLITALFLAALVFALAACGERGGTAPAPGGAPGQIDTATVDDLVMAFRTWTLPGDTEMIQDHMNEILIPRYGINVELLIMDVAAYTTNIRLMLTAGEQIDVLSTIGAGYSHLQQQGFLLNLEANNLLQNFGPGIVDAVGGWDIVDGARIAGNLYGIPTNCDHAVGRGTISVGDDLDLYDQLMRFNAESQQSIAFGFAFDPTPVQNEIAAVTNVRDELLAGLGLGFVDPTTGIATFNERLFAAGLQRIMDEKQSQLDAWAAAVGLS